MCLFGTKTLRKNPSVGENPRTYKAVLVKELCQSQLGFSYNLMLILKASSIHLSLS
jgi:hypothetical protein